jgi:hypothetical protein
MKTLPGMFFEVVRTYSDRPALIDGNRTITYRELGERVGQIAAQLSNIGVMCGERVALLLANGPEFVDFERDIRNEARAIFPNTYVARDFDHFQISRDGTTLLKSEIQ